MERLITINGRRYLGGRYPFSEIHVGGSFFVPYRQASPYNVKQAVHARNKKGLDAFACSLVEGGVLVRRLALEQVFRP